MYEVAKKTLQQDGTIKQGFYKKKEYRDDKTSQNVSVNKKIEE